MLMYRGLPLSEWNNPTLYWTKMGPVYGTAAIITVIAATAAFNCYENKKQQKKLEEIFKLITK